MLVLAGDIAEAKLVGGVVLQPVTAAQTVNPLVVTAGTGAGDIALGQVVVTPVVNAIDVDLPSPTIELGVGAFVVTIPQLQPPAGHIWVANEIEVEKDAQPTPDTLAAFHVGDKIVHFGVEGALYRYRYRAIYEPDSLLSHFYEDTVYSYSAWSGWSPTQQLLSADHEFYVDPDYGDNSVNDGSDTAPFLTIARALTEADTKRKLGERSDIKVYGGEYRPLAVDVNDGSDPVIKFDQFTSKNGNGDAWVRVARAAPKPWQDGKAYTVHTRVSHEGSEYRCASAHTATLLNDEPGTGVNWVTFWILEATPAVVDIRGSIDFSDDNFAASGWTDVSAANSKPVGTVWEKVYAFDFGWHSVINGGNPAPPEMHLLDQLWVNGDLLTVYKEGDPANAWTTTGHSLTDALNDADEQACYIDTTGAKVTIFYKDEFGNGFDPTIQGTVEVATCRRTGYIHGQDNLILQDLTVQHAIDGTDAEALVFSANGNGLILKDCELYYGNFFGVKMAGGNGQEPDSRRECLYLDGCKVNDQGGNGIGAYHTRGVYVYGCEEKNNNTRGRRASYDDWSYGNKINECHRIFIDRTLYHLNYGANKWFDLDCEDVHVWRSRFDAETEYQLYLESNHGPVYFRYCIFEFPANSDYIVQNSSSRVSWRGCLFRNKTTSQDAKLLFLNGSVGRISPQGWDADSEFHMHELASNVTSTPFDQFEIPGDKTWLDDPANIFTIGIRAYHAAGGQTDYTIDNTSHAAGVTTVVLNESIGSLVDGDEVVATVTMVVRDIEMRACWLENMEDVLIDGAGSYWTLFESTVDFDYNLFQPFLGPLAYGNVAGDDQSLATWQAAGHDTNSLYAHFGPYDRTKFDFLADPPDTWYHAIDNQTDPTLPQVTGVTAQGGDTSIDLNGTGDPAFDDYWAAYGPPGGPYTELQQSFDNTPNIQLTVTSEETVEAYIVGVTAAGVYGPPSAIVTATSNDTQGPATPANFTADTINARSVDFSWDAVADLDFQEYWMRYREVIGGVPQGWQTAIDPASGDYTALTYSLTGLDPNTEYDIELYARDDDTNDSVAASINLTTAVEVAPSLSAVAGLSPIQGTTPVVTFTYTPGDYPLAGVIFRYYTGFAPSTGFGELRGTSTQGVASITFDDPVEEEEDEDGWIEVEQVSSGIKFEFQHNLSVQGIAAPTLTAEGDGQDPGTITLNWTDAQGSADDYDIEIQATGGDWSTLVGGTPSSPATTAFSPSGLADTTTYDWRVRKNIGTAQSAWSAVDTFTTGSAGAGSSLDWSDNTNSHLQGIFH